MMVVSDKPQQAHFIGKFFKWSFPIKILVRDLSWNEQTNDNLSDYIAQLAGAVEYTDYISAEV